MSHVTHMSRVTHVEKSFDMRFLHCCVYRVRGRVEFVEDDFVREIIRHASPTLLCMYTYTHFVCVYAINSPKLYIAPQMKELVILFR